MESSPMLSIQIKSSGRVGPSMYKGFNFMAPHLGVPRTSVNMIYFMC